MLDREHGWQIPTDDLRAAGLLNSPAVPAGQIEAEAVMPDSQDTSVLERQLVEERHSRELAQAEASRLRVLLDLQNQHLTALRRALHVLTAAPLAAGDRQDEVQAGITWQEMDAVGVVRPRGSARASDPSR
ncbi:hypothetical protein ACTPOK_10330 [Streptomyces inhibens]|uniref:hypothetical protein n=1 Tax=Streptomyces inhibens TaxID=2293571 RepID=UPI00402AA01A